jgi:hypothetical protein
MFKSIFDYIQKSSIESKCQKDLQKLEEAVYGLDGDISYIQEQLNEKSNEIDQKQTTFAKNASPTMVSSSVIESLNIDLMRLQSDLKLKRTFKDALMSEKNTLELYLIIFRLPNVANSIEECEKFLSQTENTSVENIIKGYSKRKEKFDKLLQDISKGTVQEETRIKYEKENQLRREEEIQKLLVSLPDPPMTTVEELNISTKEKMKEFISKKYIEVTSF